MDYLLGTALGGLVAFAFSIPAVIFDLVERGRVGNLPLVVDVKTILGRQLDRYEAFTAALLLHMVIGACFGLGYVAFVRNAHVLPVAPYSFASLLVYAVATWLFVGLVLFPTLGMGFFGRKEGKRVWMEMLASHVVLGVGLWVAVQYYQPYFF